MADRQTGGSTNYGVPRGVDTSIPSAARVYDYLLGGGHNFDVDRRFAGEVEHIAPFVRDVARLNRSLLRRVVTYLLDNGVRQFLDLGSGIPTVGNVHEIVDAHTPDGRVVYVDCEPVACAHSALMLRGHPGATVIQADLREPRTILEHEDTRRLLDFSQPVAVLMIGVLLFIEDEDDPASLVAAYRDHLTEGSYLAISHLTDDEASPELRGQVAALVRAYEQANERVQVRTRQHITGWFDGMELVAPGVVLMPDWGSADSHEQSLPARALGYAGVGRIAPH